ALEAGGTKMVCAFGDMNGNILEQQSIPTTTPQDTMPAIMEFFREKKIESVGIGCFGPVDVRQGSSTWGTILDTPKLPWRNFNIAGVIKEELGVPVGIDTDVNGSLLGEVTYGAAKGLTDVVYITIGTGVGAGIMSGGRLIHGMLHPEAGHIKLIRVKGDDYAGKCPYHKECFEGLASGPAIEERWGEPGRALADRPEVWELEAEYIARAIASLVMILSPQRIILGGGVMHQLQLFPMIREKVIREIGGYIKTGELSDIDGYIVPASLNDDQGIMGALKLAIDACGDRQI
ncbi:MAG: ROK family protein, partial [Oscillospiraceae bacterium]|nr:ROK family protein [Oscillospiraceae bacterium]